MRVMALVGLIFHMRGRNGDAARLLFRRLVDLVIGRVRRLAGLCQNLGDRRRQRRLAVIDVTDRPDVAMRLGAVEFLFGQGPLRMSSFLYLRLAVRRISPEPLGRRSVVPARSDRIAW